MRGGDHGAEVERDASADGGRRQHAPENGVAAGATTTRGERLLELGPEPRVSRPTKTRAARRPERGRAAEPLDELGRQDLPDDPADAVGPEVPRGHGAAVKARGC